MRILSLLLFLILVSCKNEPKQNEQLAKSEDNSIEQSMELEVYDYEGLKKYLTTTSDKTYVVNFWATWCAPCVKELPSFEALNSKYGSENVEVILVSLDFPNKYESKLKPFIKEKGLKSKVVALNDTDSNMWIPKINENWSGAIPATLIFNKNKRQFYEQSFTYDELETEVKQFLK
ncbi:MAG: TlpA family protein disulfide reductase [Gelidibacter sp.]|nr:TlpA family protein disulfide reductase [Gelidibacter sp.]